MKKLIALFGVLILTACATPAIISATVPSSDALAAASAFDIVEGSATAYLQLPACGATKSVACHSTAAVTPIVNAVRSGRVARNAVLAAVKSACGTVPATSCVSTSIPVASYNNLVNASAVLKAIYSEYGVTTN